MDTPTIYCEQICYGSIQYLNVVSNVFFILFGALAIQQLVRMKEASKISYLLSILLGIVGLGSTAWHTNPNNWTDYADTIPIIIFVFVSLGLIFKKIFTKNKVLRFLVLSLTLLIGLILEQISLLNGSLPYIFIFLVLMAISIFFFRGGTVSRKNFINASMAFMVALIARTLDLYMCNWIPMGTHFIWHILIGYTGYQIILGISHLYKLPLQDSEQSHS